MTNTTNAIHEEMLRINTFECDINQNWKPAAFFQHLTEAAANHVKKLGVGFDALYARNLFWVQSRMKIKFFHMPRMGETITIRTWPKTIQQKLFFIRDFEVLDAGSQLLAAATSAWLIINATTRRLVPPLALNFTLPALNDHFGLDEPLDRLDLAQDGEERLRLRAGYSSVDIVGHVNNSRYVEWVCDAFPTEMFRQHKLDWMQINYDHEILPGEEVSMLVNPVEQDDGLWAVEGFNRSSNTHAFEAALRWQD